MLRQLTSVETEMIDLSKIGEGTVVTRRILQPAPQVSFPSEGEVKVYFGTGGD